MARPRATLEHLELTGQTKKHSRYRSYRKDSAEPLPVETVLKPRKSWSKESKELLKLSSQWLLNEKLLREVDLPNIEIMVNAYDDYLMIRRKRAQFEQEHDITEMENLKTVEKLSKVELSFYRLFDSIASRYGLTPLDRQRLLESLGGEEEEEPTPMELLFREMG